MYSIFKIWAITMLLCSINVHARHFVTSFSNADWSLVSSPLVCQLEHEIAQFGRVTFKKVNAGKLQFTVRSYQGLIKPVFGQLYIMAPPWKIDQNPKLMLKQKLSQGRDILKLSEIEAHQLLAKLNQGLMPRLKYITTGQETVRVDILPNNFQVQYERYVKCLSNLFDYKLEDVKKSIVHFERSSLNLSEKSKKHIKHIISYVNADDNILGIELHGYADMDGRRGDNRYLSERRAKAVKAYMNKHGLLEKKVMLTWHGAQDPIADNETANGRAQNRRVEIKLIQ